VNPTRFLLCALSLSAAGASQAQTHTSTFDAVLTRCLSAPSASVLDCAGRAGNAAGVAKLTVEQTRTVNPAGRPGTRNHVESCSTDGYEICHHYNCDEADGQSICDFVGTTCGEYWC